MDSLQTNWAEIANRIIDMGESAYMNIASTIKEIAPDMWEMLIRQVYAESVSNLITSLLFLIVCWRFASKCYHANSDKESEFYKDEITSFGIIGGYMATFCCFIWFNISLFDGIKVFINPEYYAIQKFFEIIKGGGM